MQHRNYLTKDMDHEQSDDNDDAIDDNSSHRGRFVNNYRLIVAIVTRATRPTALRLCTCAISAVFNCW